MPRPKASSSVSISRPFDARHISGVSVVGNPPRPSLVANLSTAYSLPPTSTATTVLPAKPPLFFPGLEPDEAPTHLNFGSHTRESRRSNSLARSVTRPHLRLKTSISRLRGRSLSRSPDDSSNSNSARVPTHPPQLPDIPIERPGKNSGFNDILSSHASPPPPQQQHQQQPSLLSHHPITRDDVPQFPHRATPHLHDASFSSASTSSGHRPAPPPLPPRVPPHGRPQPQTRPKRADSGTAITFDDVPVGERPLGFKAILSMGSLEERMREYGRAREFWARADHGFGEWVMARV